MGSESPESVVVMPKADSQIQSTWGTDICHVRENRQETRVQSIVSKTKAEENERGQQLPASQTVYRLRT